LAFSDQSLISPGTSLQWWQMTATGLEQRAVSFSKRIQADTKLEILKDAKTIIVPGWRDRSERPPERLLATIHEASQQGARCLSICSGVFVLAAAGLLDGKRATTHWRHAPYLKSLYPDIQFEEDVLYVDEGNVITSAGSAAGIDACLHLVRRDFGSKVANSVARRLVMPPHRDGGQAQYIAAPMHERSGQAMSEVMDWARQRIAQPIRVTDLAKHAAMSERTFLRRFREAVGQAPMVWLLRERMFRAQEMLEISDIPLGDIADQCGFRSLETFRASFKRVIGTSPAAYRSRFRRSE